jgi:Uma2 family endonuclease
MEEYRASGARLGWLIDPVERQVHVYGGAGTPRRLESPLQLSGDPVLPGFVLDLAPVWAPDL